MLTRPSGEGEVDAELVVLTLFAGATVAGCHGGEVVNPTASFDRSLPLVFDRSVEVYEVLTEPCRTSSYANLRRRFPLRLMAPR